MGWVELTKQDGSSSEPVEFSFTPNNDMVEATRLQNRCPTIISMLKPKLDLMPDMESLPDDNEASREDMMLTDENGTSSSKPNSQIIQKRRPASIIIPSPKVISSS